MASTHADRQRSHQERKEAGIVAAHRDTGSIGQAVSPRALCDSGGRFAVSFSERTPESDAGIEALICHCFDPPHTHSCQTSAETPRHAWQAACSDGFQQVESVLCHLSSAVSHCPVQSHSSPDTLMPVCSAPCCSCLRSTDSREREGERGMTRLVRGTPYIL